MNTPLTQPTEQFPESYWDFNLPLQISINEDNGPEEYEDEVQITNQTSYSILNYMPRRDSCDTITERMTPEELKIYCQNTANTLRNLATLFELFGDNKIKHIYYPDKNIEEAIKEKEEKNSTQN